MKGTQERPRRYPAAPYPPHTEEAARYRDGWDRGWEMAASRTRATAYGTDLEPGPYRHGFRDGAAARWAREEKLRRPDRAARAREQAEARGDTRRGAVVRGQRHVCVREKFGPRHLPGLLLTWRRTADGVGSARDLGQPGHGRRAAGDRADARPRG